MGEYTICFQQMADASSTVQADNLEDAINLAYDKLDAWLCHQCARSVNLAGDWEVDDTYHFLDGELVSTPPAAATQTVSTPAEFDALPDGSVITWGGRVCQKTPEDKGAGWYMPGWAYAMPVESLLMDSDDQAWTVIGADHG